MVEDDPLLTRRDKETSLVNRADIEVSQERQLQLDVIDAVASAVGRTELSVFADNHTTVRIADYEDSSREQVGFLMVKVGEIQPGVEEDEVTYSWEDGGLTREATVDVSYFKALYADSVVDTVSKVFYSIGDIDDRGVLTDILDNISPGVVVESDVPSELKRDVYVAISERVIASGATDQQAESIIVGLVDSLEDERLVSLDIAQIPDGPIYDKALEVQTEKRGFLRPVAEKVANNISDLADSVKSGFVGMSDKDKRALKQGSIDLAKLVALELATYKGPLEDFLNSLPDGLGRDLGVTAFELLPVEDLIEPPSMPDGRAGIKPSDDYFLSKAFAILAQGANELDLQTADFQGGGRAVKLLKQFAGVVEHLPDLKVAVTQAERAHSASNTLGIVKAVIEMNRVRRTIRE